VIIVFDLEGYGIDVLKNARFIKYQITLFKIFPDLYQLFENSPR